jgi:hypothetical protein
MMMMMMMLMMMVGTQATEFSFHGKNEMQKFHMAYKKKIG